MIQSGLPPSYWVDAVLHAGNVYDVTTCEAMNKLTRHEVFTGQKPDVSFFRTFDCAAYEHAPRKIQAGKFSKRFSKCVVLSHERGVYKIGDLNVERCV